MTQRNLKQKITRWVPTPDGFGGSSFSVPTDLMGRWEEQSVLFRDIQGEEVISNAVVYLDTDVEVNDLLFLGFTAELDPTTLSGVYVVRQFHKTPDLRAVANERKAFL